MPGPVLTVYRRKYTEEKAKVVWGTDFIKFFAAFSYFAPG